MAEREGRIDFTSDNAERRAVFLQTPTAVLNDICVCVCGGGRGGNVSPDLRLDMPPYPRNVPRSMEGT